MKNQRPLLSLAVLVIAVGSCRAPISRIFASDPEVYARERLVGERVRELQWLRGKLDGPIDLGLQGRVEIAEEDRRRLAFEASVKVALEQQGAPDAESQPFASALPDAATISATGIGLTPTDRLRAEEAYRSAVLSSIRRVSLDDAHDLSGKRLVEFTMNLGVLPAENETRFAAVQIELCPTDAVLRVQDVEGALLRELGVLEHQVQEEIERAVERLLVNGIAKTGEDLEKALQVSPQPLGADFSLLRGFSDQQMSGVSALLGKYHDEIAAGTTNFLFDASALVLARSLAIVKARMCGIDASWIEFHLLPPLGSQDPSGLIPQVQIACTERGIERFIAHVRRESLAGEQIRVTDVDPSEASQFIDVAAARDVERVLSGKGSFADSSLGLSIALNHLKRRVDKARGNTQIPQIVGFGSGRGTATWVLGPTFQVHEQKKQRRVHTPSRYDVTLRAVMPASARTVVLKGSYQWIDKHGKPCGSLPLFANGQSGLEVEIPPDVQALASRFVAPMGQGRHPKIENHQGELREGLKDQTILIEGRQLWRNPMVFVAGQQASQVDVVPNMSGLVATFDSVQVASPRHLSTPTVDLPLTVVTSTGVAWGFDVTVHRAPGPSAFAQLATKYLVGKGKLSFLVDDALAPGAFHHMNVTLRKNAGAPFLYLPPAREVRFDGTQRLWDFSLSSEDLKKVHGGKPVAGPIQVGLVVVLEPGGDPKRVPNLEQASFTWFPTTSASLPKLKVSAAAVNGSTLIAGKVTLGTIEVLWNDHARAFQQGKGFPKPGAGPLAVSLKVDGKSILNLTDVPGASDTTVMKIPVTPALVSALVAAGAKHGKTIDVTLEIDHGGKAPLPLGGSLKVMGEGVSAKAK